MNFATPRIAIHGAAGRMGRALIQAAQGQRRCALERGDDRSDVPELGKDAGVMAGGDRLTWQ